jgi:hypothetical protein
MRATLRWTVVALMLAPAALRADDHSVIWDEDVDFSTFKTFTIADARVMSGRPELMFPALAKTLADAIRTALTANGLRPTADRADLVVEFGVTGVDYVIGPFGRANRVTAGRGRGGRASPSQVDFTEATMVLDLKRADSGVLLWRGVYHDTEMDAQKLAAAVPADAAKLLAQYPGKRRK